MSRTPTFDNLIHSRNITDWEAVDLSATSSNWEKTPEGIVQTQVVGTRKTVSGSLLLLNTPVDEAYAIGVSTRTGARYKTGMVVNFTSLNHYFLFYVDRYAGTGKCQVTVAKVVDGDFTQLCKEKCELPTSGLANFMVVAISDGLSFSLNGNNIYVVKHQLLNGKVGLYTQQNDDALFTQCLVTTEDARATLPSTNNSWSTSGQHAPTLPSTTNGNSSLLHFLNIKPPASKTQVEFMEVFAVPLDSFYNSLNDVIHAGKPDNSSAFVEKTKLIDQRPRRWYRELKYINDDLALLSKKLLRKGKMLSLAEDAIDDELDSTGTSRQRLKLLEQDAFEKEQEYRAVQLEIDQKKAEKTALQRTIKTNGYLLQDIGENDPLYAEGYTFSISKPVAKGLEFEPVPLPDTTDAFDDAWEALETKLYKALFNTGAISETGKSLYTLAQKELVSVDDNTSLQAKINVLEASIASIDLGIAAILSGEGNAQEVAAIDDWKLDKMALEAERNNYLPFDPDDYPMITATSDPLKTSSTAMVSESEKLRNWIATHVPITGEEATSLRNEISEHNNQYVFAEDPLGYINNLYIGDNFVSQLPLYRMKKLVLSQFLFDAPYPNGGGSYIFHAGILHPEIAHVYSREAHVIYDADGYRRVYISQGSKRLALDISKFFDYAIATCDAYIAHHEANIENSTTALSKLRTERTLKATELQQLKDSGILPLRQQFFTFWNDPENELLQDMNYELVAPDGDPLTDFLVEQEQRIEQKEVVKTYLYTPTEDGYYNQYGQSLRAFINNDQLRLQPNVSLFPIMDDDGNYSGEVIKAVKNPKQSMAKPHLPIIKFIETYQIEIGWQGYGLSELNHTINLFPGEIKELVVEKKTSITKKQETSRTEGQEVKQHVTSSFEDNLQNEFSEQDKSEAKDESKQKTDASTSGESNQSRTSESSRDFSASASVSGSFWGVKASASASASSKRKNTSASSTKRAFSMAQSREGLRASNQSKDVLKKNVSNSIKKVANDTSRNNKVEFSSVSSEEFQEDIANKETIKLENPNIGRTVNYNFFQVQNHFGTTLKLTDVKIMINSGQEIIEGTGIQDMRVFELEEFGKIYANSVQTDHEIVVSSIIARQVFKHYANFLPGITSGNGALHIDEHTTIDPELIKILMYSSEELESATDKQALLEKIKDGLESLKAVPFSFKEQLVQEKTTLAVNAGAYHMEANVGLLPATENYLEERRVIERKMQEAEVEHLKARTAAQAFFPPAEGVIGTGSESPVATPQSTDSNG